MAQSVAHSNHSRWSDENDQILTEMANNGMTTVEIARQLGRTKASVWARKSKLGIDVRLATSKDRTYPQSLRSNKRKTASEVVTKTVTNVPTVTTTSSIDLDAAAAVAQKYGVKVTVVQFG